MFAVIFAIIAYALTALGYLLRIPEALGSFMTFIGMLILVSGYSTIMASKIYYALKEKKEEESKKTDNVVDEEVQKLEKSKKLLEIVGFSILAFFFIAIHFVPSLTFEVRYYDKIGAIGYLLVLMYVFFQQVPVYIVYIPLILYYIFGGIRKIFEHGPVFKLQMVSRFMLAGYLIYYVFIKSFLG